MNSQYRFRAWAAVLLAVLAAVSIGTVAYQAGVTHGLALQVPSGQIPPGVVPYGWYRPWGFGFGFGPFLFLLFWFVLFRAVVWGGWRRRWHHVGPDYLPPRFEEWHRRAHDQMKGESSSQSTV